MPEYRYFSADVQTGTPVMELPLSGVYMTKQLSDAGEFTGTITLGTGEQRDDLLIAGTLPGKHCIMAQRDGVFIWGGPIWGRTYSSESRQIQLAASTFESIFEHLDMDFDCIYQNVDQVTIASDWLTKVQAMSSGATNFNLVGVFPGTPTVSRTVLIPAYEHHMAQDLLNQITDATDALTYTVNFANSSTIDVPTRNFVMRRRDVDVVSGQYYEYPGNIARYWMNEAGARMARKSVAVGAGSGSSILTRTTTITPSGSYPLWAAVEMYPEVGDGVLLNTLSQRMSKQRTPPVWAPTYELADVDNSFVGWDMLGQLFTTSITDDRFPSGQSFTNKLLGWALTPSSGDEIGTIQFTLEGDQ